MVLKPTLSHFKSRAIYMLFNFLMCGQGMSSHGHGWWIFFHRSKSLNHPTIWDESTTNLWRIYCYVRRMRRTMVWDFLIIIICFFFPSHLSFDMGTSCPLIGKLKSIWIHINSKCKGVGLAIICISPWMPTCGMPWNELGRPSLNIKTLTTFIATMI